MRALGLVVLASSAFAQSGTFTVQGGATTGPNIYNVTRMIPPAGPGMGRLWIEAQPTITNRLCLETNGIGPYTSVGRNTAGWRLTAGLPTPTAPFALLFAGRKMAPPLNIDVPVGQPFDGVIDGQGPSAFCDSNVSLGGARSVVVPVGGPDLWFDFRSREAISATSFPASGFHFTEVTHSTVFRYEYLR